MTCMLSQKQLKNCNLYDMLVLLPSLKEAQVKHGMVGYPRSSNDS